MKQSIIDKLSAPIQKDMLRVEGIMKKLEMNFAEGYMDEVAEAICRIRPQTQTKVRPIDLKEAWEFSNRAIRVATDLARIKSNKAALYFIYGMDYERPITEKLDKAVEAEVYEAIKKYLGFE